MRTWTYPVLLLVVTMMVTSATAAPRHRKAMKLLKLLKEVDGVGSGLDADTVRGISPVTVVDADGRVVGTWFGPLGSGSPTVVRRLDGHPVQLTILPGGFEQYVQFSYESNDCSGVRLMQASTGLEPDDALVLAGTAYYPVDPSTRTRHSLSRQPSTESECPFVFVPPDTCCYPNVNDGADLYGAATSFDLKSLGLRPPFHLDVP